MLHRATLALVLLLAGCATVPHYDAPAASRIEDGSSLDLYAARCGIVHTFMAESDLSDEGQVEKVLYAWGASRADTMSRALRLTGMTGWAMVQIEDLIEAFKLGVTKFLGELGDAPERPAGVYNRAGKWLTTQPAEQRNEMIRLSAQALGIPISDWERPTS